MGENCRVMPSVELLTRQVGKVSLEGKPAIDPDSNQMFAAVRNLPEEQVILFFTPAIASRTDSDPFEPLGRAIHSYHRKVRHVPYSLIDGFTYVHEAHLAHPSVGAVFIIILSGDDYEEKWLDQQKNFSDSVLKRTNRPDGTTLPSVRMRIGAKGTGGASGWDCGAWCGGQGGSDQLARMADRVFTRGYVSRR